MTVCDRCANFSSNGGECIGVLAMDGCYFWHTPMFPEVTRRIEDEQIEINGARPPRSEEECSSFKQVVLTEDLLLSWAEPDELEAAKQTWFSYQNKEPMLIHPSLEESGQQVDYCILPNPSLEEIAKQKGAIKLATLIKTKNIT